MNFFSEQDKARRQTTRLVVLFGLAVLSLIVITNVLVLVFFYGGTEGVVSAHLSRIEHPGSSGFLHGFWQRLDWQRVSVISLVVCTAVAGAILLRWSQLKAGGRAVAEALGGVRVASNTEDAALRRLLNVVEEMAIASGVPVPPVYVLQQEPGINAFAAGLTQADAVIGVTRGTVDQLNREQLQGVIAHEFSHVFNGDMRLNIRLVAVLYGILFIGEMGRVLLRSQRHSRNQRHQGSAALLGLGLIIIGWLGMLFGGLIKAAVSRQREFLADASAVQFTRNPQGIAGALKRIGGFQPGSKVAHPGSGEISHLFFANALLGKFSWFATHPPLAERIKRIEPSWRGRFPKVTPVAPSPGISEPGVSGFSEASATAPPTPAATVQFAVLPALLTDAAHEPFLARGLVYLLILSADDAVRSRQWSLLDAEDARLMDDCRKRWPAIQSLPMAQRLTLIELAMPALKAQSKPQYLAFKHLLVQLAKVDGQIDLLEWCWVRLVEHYCDAHFLDAKPPTRRYKQAADVSDAYAVVLTLLARHGNDDAQQQTRAFNAGTTTAGLYTLTLLPAAQAGLSQFDQAVKRLAQCYPLVLPRLLKGLVKCARFDATLAEQEMALVGTLALLLDCPVVGLDQADAIA